MIFLTVGTQFPFDRLVKSVDEMVGHTGLTEEIFGQIGDTPYRPRNFHALPSLDKELFDARMGEASCVISHAGMGTITMALAHDKPLLVMPRRERYGEVVNDHQVAIARKFEQMGHLLVAYDAEELPDKIAQLKHFVPRKRMARPFAVTQRIADYLQEIAGHPG